MELQIASALKQPGESFPFALEEPVGPQSFGGRMVAFEAPLSVAGRYVFDGKAVLVDGTVQTRLHSVCARCNEPFSEPLAFAFSERFVKASELGPEDESYPYEGSVLSLAQAVMDNLFLQLPLVSVCRPDCKGLCPVCGVNRNHTACACAPARPIGAFAVLHDFGNDQ